MTPPTDPAAAADRYGRRLLVLGAGRHQAGLIERAEELGVQVVAADYYEDAPGKAHATFPELVDALDTEANIALGKRHEVSGVITLGTDMAVATMAEVAAALGLPCHLTPEAAHSATDKGAMGAAFAAHGVRRARYIEASSPEEAMRKTGHMRFPFVVKPVDSQGQRATKLVPDRGALAEAVGAAVAESRRSGAIIEEFVPGKEITASVWVSGGVPHSLMVTDRVTMNPPPAIGIAFQHVYPSLWGVAVQDEIDRQVAAVAEAYGVVEGPLYIQMLVTDDGRVVVVEAGGRVGGGHEASLLPLVTGVDVIDRLIDLALNGTAAPVVHHHGRQPVTRHALVNFLVARPGVVTALAGFPDVVDRGLVDEGGFYVTPGHEQTPIVNSLGRVGYFVASATSRNELLDVAREAYGSLHMGDATGSEMLFWPDPSIMNG